MFEYWNEQSSEDKDLENTVNPKEDSSKFTVIAE